MAKPLDLTGHRFGWLTVLSRADHSDSQHRILWNCLCDCGNECQASGMDLRRGHKKSCGCLRDKRLSGKLSVSDKKLIAEKERALAGMSRFRLKNIKLTWQVNQLKRELRKALSSR